MGREDVDCLAARPPVLNQLRVSDHSPVCTLLPSHLTPRPHCTLHYYHNSPGTLATHRPGAGYLPWLSQSAITRRGGNTVRLCDLCSGCEI